jgi:hypothetical protein
LITHSVGARAHCFSFRRDDLRLGLRHVRLGGSDRSRQLIRMSLGGGGGSVRLRDTAARGLYRSRCLLNSSPGRDADQGKASARCLTAGNCGAECCASLGEFGFIIARVDLDKQITRSYLLVVGDVNFLT